MSILNIDIFDVSTLSAAQKVAVGVCLRVINSLIVVALGVAINFAVKRVITFISSKAKKRGHGSNHDTAATVFISVTRYAVFFLVAFNVLSLFGVPVESLIAVAGVGSIAIGFGARAIAEDFITGAFILVEGQFAVGDYVKIGEYDGTVEYIGLRVSKIRALDGNVHIIPNSAIKTVTNMSKSFARAVVEIPVAYDEDINRVLNMITDEMALIKTERSDILTEPVVHGVTDMNGQSLTVRVVADCMVSKNWEIERLIRLRVKERFDREGVAPPFPRYVLKNE